MARIRPVEFDDSQRWSCREPVVVPTSPRPPPARFLAAIRRRWARRAAIRELGSLDRRLLTDIGIERDDIESFVDAMIEMPDGQRRGDGRQRG